MDHRKRTSLILLAGSYLIYLIFGLLAEGSWDDDCITRFYGTSNAFSDPNIWVDIFIRPLWVLVFALPVQLGYWVVPVLMSGLCALAAYALYRSAKITGQKHAWLVIILLLFQAYFFGVGKNALSEPLAALLIGLGYWSLLEKKYLWFVMCGALLPLARLELVVLLSFWAIILLKERQWKLIPLLGVGLVVWNFAGMLISGSGDAMWLVHQVLGRGEDPYGEVSYFAFVDRYFYVVGPVVFLLLMLGLFEGVRRQELNLFVHGQFILGIALYSVLAAAWDTARSGAFLRHMIVVAPFAALIALDGFNYLWDMIREARNRRLLAVYFGLILAVTWLVYRNEMVGHHEYSETFSWLNFPGVALLATGILGLAFFSSEQFRHKAPSLAAIVMSVLAVSFTVFTEHPRANINPERVALNEASDIYLQTDLHSKSLLANHPYFLKRINWPADRWKTNDINLENLQRAGTGTVVVWDGHHSTPRKGGINNTELGRLGYIELFRIPAADNSYSVIVYEKNPDAKAGDFKKRIDGLLEAVPDSPHLHFALARDRLIAGDLKATRQHLDRAMALDSTQFVFHTMMGDLAIFEDRLENAIVHFKKSLSLCPNQWNVNSAMGTVFLRLGRNEEALDALTASIEINPEIGDSYFRRGLAFHELSHHKEACQDWEKGKALRDAKAAEQFRMHCTGI